MGQQVSQNDQAREAVYEKRRLKSNAEVMELFNKRAVSLFTVTELAAFKSRLDGKSLSEPITSADVMRWLHIPHDNVLLCEIVFNFIRVLSNFPLMKDAFEDVTGIGLLKSIILVNHSKCQKYVGHKDYDHLKLLFIALSTRKSVKEESSESSLTSSEEGDDIRSIIKNYNNVVIDDLSIPAASLLQFFTWLLLLNSYCPTSNCQFPGESVYEGWPQYKQAAMNLLRSMNSDIVSTLVPHYINYDQFSKTIIAIVPNIFSPLQKIMEHLLYEEGDLLAHSSTSEESLMTSKLMTQAVLAQLASSLPNELSFSKLQKLYVGRESGFSMRSLQAKAFKWMAPTILLLSGKAILDDEEFCKKNPRYKKFLLEYPKLKDDDQHLNESQLNKSKVIFAVYIPEPWKVTNKDFFGGSGTTIVQLSPRQDIFKASRSSTVYFNTIGGGIGIGDNQPHIKANSKSYAPGNVSLTLDNTLEFAVFRHVGYGGAFDPGTLLTLNHLEDKSFEIRFLVQDVEVWGCGGEKELEEQLKKWQWEELEAKRRQQINLRSIGEDRALLEMAGIIGHAQSGGSM